MRKRTWLTWAVALLVLVFVPLTIDGKPAPVNFKTELTKLADRYLPNYDAQQSTSSTQKRETSSADQTPIENIVQGKTLKKTYYYHFASDVSSSAQVAFEAAVATYNATGLVKLVAGNATDKQNSITFFVYEKQMSSANTQQGMIESGHGGPKIIQQTGWGAYTVNHARAGLNVAYPQQAIKQSVATHELGHALGLDHSTSKLSVMYPVDQSRTTLSTADLNALKAIYND